MKAPRQVIENIRRKRFGIGRDTTGLSEEIIAELEDKDKVLEDASRLAKEIHTRNPHFIFELIQNAEDNHYKVGVKPSIKFILDGSQLIIQNNEDGFKEDDVWALCGIGGSTKKDNKSLGFIGEKGIGFKSVFMVADKVQIYSNRFQFGFNYNKDDSKTMIIPEWIDEVPGFVNPEQTNIILDLNPEAIKEIKNYFEKIRPSLLLFLRTLKIIEVMRSENGESSTKKMEMRKRDGIVEIIYGERKNYWKVVKKVLKVPANIEEERRKGVEKTEIVLAFPLNKDLSADTSTEQPVFAFLPVNKFGFKFIIQADFILPITRENIIKDIAWNKWLRDSIVDVVVDAINEFKGDENLKYSFHNYFDFENAKDEFFLSLTGRIYKMMAESDSVLSETGNWKKPAEILIDDKEIKK